MSLQADIANEQGSSEMLPPLLFPIARILEPLLFQRSTLGSIHLYRKGRHPYTSKYKLPIRLVDEIMDTNALLFEESALRSALAFIRFERKEKTRGKKVTPEQEGDRWWEERIQRALLKMAKTRDEREQEVEKEAMRLECADSRGMMEVSAQEASRLYKDRAVHAIEGAAQNVMRAFLKTVKETMGDAQKQDQD